MTKELVHSFTIKLASSKTVRNSNKEVKGKSIGKKRQAVVVKDEDVLKARLVSSPVEEENNPQEHLILPFTAESFSLKDKICVFLKEKDEYNHYVCIIRDYMTAKLHPGVDTQYDSLKEGLLISGHIISRNGLNYFNYEDLISYTEYGKRINEPIMYQ